MARAGDLQSPLPFGYQRGKTANAIRRHGRVALLRGDFPGLLVDHPLLADGQRVPEQPAPVLPGWGSDLICLGRLLKLHLHLLGIVNQSPAGRGFRQAG